MTDIAKQIHSLDITVGDTKINTYDDWHLVPKSRPVFAPPSLKKYSQDIPGTNGEIDLTTALTGYPAYQNRTGSIDFMVMHNGLSSSLGDDIGYNNNSNSRWQGMYSEIENFLHGQAVKIESSDFPDWYYSGRMTVSGWTSDEQYSTITINYDLEPFRYSITESADLWKWDPFNFKTGLIRTYGSMDLGASHMIVGTVTPIIPTVFVTSACTVTTPTATVNLKSGSNKNPLLVIYPGKQTWSFTGSGKVGIYFRERSL